jgi:Flp pilus assembly protein TadD
VKSPAFDPMPPVRLAVGLAEGAARIAARGAVRFAARSWSGASRRSARGSRLVVTGALALGLASVSVTMLELGGPATNVENAMRIDDELPIEPLAESGVPAALVDDRRVERPARGRALEVHAKEAAEVASPQPASGESVVGLSGAASADGSPVASRPSAGDVATAARLFGRSQRALAVRQYQAALAAATAAWARNPGDPRIANHLAATYVELGEAGDAETWSRRALAIDPGLSRAWTNLGVALLAQGRAAEAHDAHRCALELEPTDWRALSGCAAAQRALGDVEGSLESLTRATALAPHRPELHYGLAVTHEKAGDLDAAREEFLRYVELSRGSDPKRETAVREWLSLHQG